jgi:hypothetical protein
MTKIAELPPLPTQDSNVKCDALQAERRAQGRRFSGQVACLRYQADASAAHYQLVTIWNASPEGLGLFLKRPVEPGMVFHIQFRHLAVRDRVATVLHVTPHDSGWLVGCQLDEQLRSDELRALRF